MLLTKIRPLEKDRRMKENLESEKEESTLVQKSMESLAVVNTEIIAHATQGADGGVAEPKVATSSRHEEDGDNKAKKEIGGVAMDDDMKTEGKRNHLTKEKVKVKETKKKGKGGGPKKKKAHSCNRCNKEFKFPTFLAEVYAF